MIAAWLLFIAFIVVLLVIDLGVLHRTPHARSASGSRSPGRPSG
jgi:hypothetical protein